MECVCGSHFPFPIWSSVLISVTREWHYCGLVYKFSLINNIELKCSFVQCRKYHKSWSNGTAELQISVDLLCGTSVAELHNSVDLLCDTLAAELHNSVNFPCGTIDCLQSTFSLLNSSSSYLIQRVCTTRRYYYQREWDVFFSGLRPCFSRLAALLLACLGFACSNFAKKIRDCSQSSGTMAAELDPVWCMHQESQTFSKDSDEPCWKIWRLNPK